MVMLMPRRRIITLTVSGVLLAAFLLTALLMPVPYAEMTPGPTFNVLGTYNNTPLVTITGHKTYPTSGELRMVTVGVTDESYRMPLGTALLGWLNTNEAIVPKETIYPPNTTQQQSDATNEQEFTDSQDEAITAALSALNIKPTGTDVEIAQVQDGSPADNKLDPGDIIVSVDGARINAAGNSALSQVTAAVQQVTAGQQVTFVVERAGKEVTVPVGTVRNSSGKASVGIGIETENTFPFQVDIQLNGVGGPSAGMMFALGIIDKLTGWNLADGKIIAGTGTIDSSGNVGAIGGVQMKTIGARRDGAVYFLTPSGNCSEAAQNAPAGLTLVKVNTLQDALTALKDIDAGKTPPTC
jgi:PDZ domain-containing protein